MYLFFDVETIGFHGEAFAVGGIVTDNFGEELDAFLFAADHFNAKACPLLSESLKWKDREWVLANVVPTIPTQAVESTNTGIDWPQMKFMDIYSTYRKKALDAGDTFYLAADCPYPCETNFLNDCMKGWPVAYIPIMPYPLIDVASVLLAMGYNPTETFKRLDSELPAHNPLNDARQSARVFFAALKKDDQALFMEDY